MRRRLRWLAIAGMGVAVLRPGIVRVNMLARRAGLRVLVLVIVRVRVAVHVIMPVAMRVIVVMPVAVRVIVAVPLVVAVTVAHFAAPSPLRSSNIRCTAMAAPKPLSMFTTTTPEAQLVSMAKSAVKPFSTATRTWNSAT